MYNIPKNGAESKGRKCYLHSASKVKCEKQGQREKSP